MKLVIEDNVLLKIENPDCEDTAVIPDGVVTIGASAFYWEVMIKKIVIPDSVKKIERNAFARSNIETIVIPDSVTELGIGVFSRCSKLRSAVIGKGVTVLPGSAFYKDQHLKWVELPDTLKEIQDDAFDGCYGLVTVRVNGKDYPIRANPAPLPVKLTFESLEKSKHEEMEYLSQCTWMDEFEYIDYCITGGDYYSY